MPQQEVDYISKYSRAEAIADGALIDVTSVAHQAGFKLHTVVTQAAAAECGIDENPEGQANLRELLHLAASRAGFERARHKALKLPPTDRWHFTVGGFGKPVVKLWAVVGPGDTEEPVVTVMLEGED